MYIDHIRLLLLSFIVRTYIVRHFKKYIYLDFIEALVTIKQSKNSTFECNETEILYNLICEKIP